MAQFIPQSPMTEPWPCVRISANLHLPANVALDRIGEISNWLRKFEATSRYTIWNEPDSYVYAFESQDMAFAFKLRWV